MLLLLCLFLFFLLVCLLELLQALLLLQLSSEFDVYHRFFRGFVRSLLLLVLWRLRCSPHYFGYLRLDQHVLYPPLEHHDQLWVLLLVVELHRKAIEPQQLIDRLLGVRPLIDLQLKHQGFLCESLGQAVGPVDRGETIEQAGDACVADPREAVIDVAAGWSYGLLLEVIADLNYLAEVAGSRDLILRRVDGVLLSPRLLLLELGLPDLKGRGRELLPLSSGHSYVIVRAATLTSHYFLTLVIN